MTEADSQNWRAFVKILHDLLCNSGFGWYARSWRDHDPCRFQPVKFVNCNLVVSEYSEFRAQLTKILNQVVGKRIVVVDNRNHSSKLFCASVMARIRARALFTVSIYSVSATESATIPPPAWIYPFPPRVTSVRIAMHESRLLLKSTYMIAPA